MITCPTGNHNNAAPYILHPSYTRLLRISSERNIHAHLAHPVFARRFPFLPCVSFSRLIQTSHPRQSSSPLPCRPHIPFLFLSLRLSLLHDTTPLVVPRSVVRLRGSTSSNLFPSILIGLRQSVSEQGYLVFSTSLPIASPASIVFPRQYIHLLRDVHLTSPCRI